MTQLKTNIAWIIIFLLSHTYVDNQCDNRLMKVAKESMDLETRLDSNEIVMRHLKNKYYE